ncbi:hypothetical protein Tco_0161735 [Tanacetum coccineum]
MNILTAFNQATGANDSSKSIPSSCRYPLDTRHASSVVTVEDFDTTGEHFIDFGDQDLNCYVQVSLSDIVVRGQKCHDLTPFEAIYQNYHGKSTPDHNEFALAAEAAINNNNGWIEWDVPLGGEMDEPMVDPGFDEEVMDDDDDVWDEDDEWLMALVTPPWATVTILSTYEVGGPSTATPIDNLEYRHEVLTRKIEAVSDVEVAHSIAIGEIHPRVTTVEEQVQTLQTALHGAELQIQQLWTRVAEMESREGTMMSYMM